ncbi:uncharacterized protein PRCAT00005566001 [Priceomyces carsonii]|uniref:uncharacterized protein n=1 Tax=Priceomyces carsonii TaxID=28549 RepID=UPI002EDB8A3A|nr:unnamed protein product [Priceomyces carsonii]
MEGNLVLPGDPLPIESKNITTNIGPGVTKDPKTQRIIPSSAGLLHIKSNKSKASQVVYIESRETRYIPKTNDFVVGVITAVFGDFYRVSLQDYSPPVQLSMTAFPNATKKNRPNLKVGQVVYARVSEAVPEIEAEIECIDPTTGKEGGFGLLDESGYLFSVRLNFARELLFNQNSIYLEKLAAKCKFEIAIGINGKIWIKCGDGLIIQRNEDSETVDKASQIKSLKTTIAAANFLIKCQTSRPVDIDSILHETFKSI